MASGTTTTIPTTQRAYVLPVVKGPFKLLDDYPVPTAESLAPGECLVRLTHSGVCHSDLAIARDEMSGRAKADLIGGHEGVGTVVAIGAHTQKAPVEVKQRVGVKFLADSCKTCELCASGWECYCANRSMTGYTVDGTFCEYVIQAVDQVVPIPDSLPGPDATAIMCAGLTVYAALRQCEAHIGDWVAIPGAGGGLGHLAIQYAVAMGLRVVAIDTGEEKRLLSLSLGAEAWIDFRESTDLVADVIAATGGGVHAAIVASGSSAAYTQAIAYLRTRGYMMVVGLARDVVVSLPVILVSARGLTIRGSFIATRQMTNEAVAIAASGKVKCSYTIRGLSELEDVYKEMSDGKIVGRVVLDLSK